MQHVTRNIQIDHKFPYIYLAGACCGAGDLGWRWQGQKAGYALVILPLRALIYVNESIFSILAWQLVVLKVVSYFRDPGLRPPSSYQEPEPYDG